MTPTPIDILLVEDNPADVRLTQEVMSGSQVPHRLHVARDGMEAMDFLHRRGRHKGACRPHLVLLDLNMPRKGGLEVLAEAKADPVLRSVPIVVLTTSGEEEDVAAAYSRHANCYVAKPMGLEGFTVALRKIEDFWLSLARLPPEVGS